ncbi:uncharacterized protein N7459_001138 [Penicillium hispanicum]|uniref:uncharacterized protein n=1 Tax=Penicillium hispanicum TaxID=1080232 RepID=UPI002541A10E|nr:uncharacterized protein N7459_001138 [Penicillium hispanicum]KAJ5594930.1 hypothetical protein N7459_001138 [Penicillium hispanicum]
MNSPSELSDYADWKVICNGHEDEEKPTDDRKPLAQTLSIPKTTMCIISDAKNDLSTVTELASPKLKLPQLSNDTTERVFPVRSVMSFDSTSSSALQTPSLDKLESPISPFSDTVRLLDETKTANSARSQMPNVNERQSTLTRRPDHLSRMHQRNQKTVSVSPSLSGVPTLKHPVASSDHPLSSLNESWELLSISEQLQQMIEEGGAVLSTGSPTEGVQFSRDNERDIEIQSSGALLVVCESGGNLIVQVASSNSPELLGHTPDELFELQSICKILPDTAKNAFLSHAEFVVDDEYEVELVGPEVFSLLLLTSEGKTKSFWCTMHTSKMYKDYIICELEPADSADSPDAGSGHTIEEHSKTESFSRSSEKETGTRAVPFYQSSSLGQQNEAVGLELLNALPRILRKLSSAQTLEALVHHAISILQQLTRFHRATMYHFDSDRNGVVIADDTDPSLAPDSYEGFHFEESAFPGHMKKQYLRNTVSFSYRGGEDVAKLVYRASINRLSLDLSHCYLPATSSPLSTSARSPIYACLSIGIYVFGKLWGLVSCQSYDKTLRLHPLVQRVSWFMSEAISSNIERLSYTLPFQLQAQDTSAEETPIRRGSKTPSGDLLALFGAEYAAAFILGETKILGKPTDSQEVLVLLEYLRAKALDTVLWSTDILADFEDLDYSPGFRHLSGLLYIPLSADGHDFIIFFRGPPGIDLVPDCFGNVPDQQNSPSGLNRRTEWSAAEFGKASILSLLYRTFTDIWQEKEVAMQNNQLMRLLLANSAHEFRTPLNAIINYLEIALDGTLNQETRENLSRSHSASKSLVYIINDLLDLTNAENGQNLIKDEVFSLSETLCEATDIFWEEARQKHVDLQVVQHSDLPCVLGDQRRVRQVITNLISNAIQHTSSGAVTIQSCILSDLWEPGHIAVEVAIHDTGLGMSQQTMETLFCELEQVSNKGYMQNPKFYGKSSDATTLETESVLGLGLALVARIVRNMNGQLSLKSEEGKGSCFKIRLKFPLPNEEDDTRTAAYAPSQHYLLQDAEGSDPLDSNQGQGKQFETKAEIKDGIPCHCGDDNLPKFTSESQDTSSVNVDVALKTGESRKITIPPSTTPGNNISAAEATVAKCHSPVSSPKTPTKPEPEEADNGSKLHVLVAEDDPINSSIVKKRLEKLGYSVRMTGNGKECAAAYREDSSFDAVLMDLQMPIVDGLSATKMIREHELQASESEPPTWHGSHRKHIPVFAVSASLIEKDLQTYVDGGFDGWIMKPIDFQRVHALLGGVISTQMRNNCLYKPGMWEIGGWFARCEGSD